MKLCSSCGRAFHPRRHYYHQCSTCWQPIDTSRSGPTYADGYLAGRSDGYRHGYEEGRAAQTPALDRGLLMEIITLVHPDHQPRERWETANRVTARLLELRETVEVGR